jgi:endonuclease/exonuclease/phosphatase family metal-dependent hydrolase
MKARILNIIFIVLLLTSSPLSAAENIRKVATWNMKWLGTSSGNQLDPVENVPEYAAYITKTQATLFALQEIGATHSVNGQPRCYYLDLIVDELNKGITSEGEKWKYILDGCNGDQRLAFLYKQDLWSLSDTCSITPGDSFFHIRRPFMATVKAEGTNAALKFNYINIHLKAMPEAEARQQRQLNIEQLSNWLETHTLDDDVLISGDTNIYYEDSGIDQPLKDIHYKCLYDPEKTTIHDGQLSQRFDRFFCSPDLKKEIDSAKNNVPKNKDIDVIEEDDVEKFDENISDHFAVVLNIDVSQER